MHTDPHTNTYTQTHTHKHIRTCIHTNTCTHLYTRVYTQTHTHVYTRKHIHTCTHTNTYTCVHIQTHTCTHANTHTHTHTHMCTHNSVIHPGLFKRLCSVVFLRWQNHVYCMMIKHCELQRPAWMKGTKNVLFARRSAWTWTNCIVEREWKWHTVFFCMTVTLKLWSEWPTMLA